MYYTGSVYDATPYTTRAIKDLEAYYTALGYIKY
jgi:hypothetical protein